VACPTLLMMLRSGKPGTGVSPLVILAERNQVLGERGLEVGQVQQPQVHVAGAEPAQRRLQRPARVGRAVVGAGPLTGGLVDGVAPLRRPDQLVGWSPSARASTRSACPAPYESAVSKNVTPSSVARRSARTDSSSSTDPQPICCVPAVIGPPRAQVPTPSALTSMPLRPRVRLTAASALRGPSCRLLSGSMEQSSRISLRFEVGEHQVDMLYATVRSVQ
jgi:hypothetical protein